MTPSSSMDEDLAHRGRRPADARPLISSATLPWPIEKTWKPPESVMIGCSQRMNSWRPPNARTRSWPGLEEQVERVPEHHVEAERPHVGRLEAAHDALGRQRDEGRRAHLAVREAQRAGARGAAARVDLERHARSVGRATQAADSIVAGWSPTAIWMRRGLASSGFGIASVSTPSTNCAVTASASTPLGSVSDRENAPNERSRRTKPSVDSWWSALRSPEIVSVSFSTSMRTSSCADAGQVGAQDVLVAGSPPGPSRGSSAEHRCGCPARRTSC